MISLPSISPARLKTRAALETRLNEARPRILGKALTGLAPDLSGLGIDIDSIRAGKAGTRKIVLEKLAKKTSATSAMSESLSSNGSVADIKADMKSEADMKRQPNVSPNVSHETFIQQEIQLSADITDMADIKKATNSRNISNKANEIAPSDASTRRFPPSRCVKREWSGVRSTKQSRRFANGSRLPIYTISAVAIW
jgi:hypothetical protein